MACWYTITKSQQRAFTHIARGGQTQFLVLRWHWHRHQAASKLPGGVFFSPPSVKVRQTSLRDMWSEKRWNNNYLQPQTLRGKRILLWNAVSKAQDPQWNLCFKVCGTKAGLPSGATLFLHLHCSWCRTFRNAAAAAAGKRWTEKRVFPYLIKKMKKNNRLFIPYLTCRLFSHTCTHCLFLHTKTRFLACSPLGIIQGPSDCCCAVLLRPHSFPASSRLLPPRTF